ncbi:MAG: hypothetical protein M5R42_05080 [Rhodocyclaceae bacterium]|nr:hypothetical protein [Rhodocyclaceae bacterium]
MPRDGRAGLDKGHVLAGQLAQQRLQERIVGAAEHQRVGTLRQQGRDESRQQRARGRAGQIARLHPLHQPRTGLHHDPGLRSEAPHQFGEAGTFQRAAGGEHADHAGTRRFDSRFHRRLHADDGQLEAPAQADDGRRSGCVAGDDQRLGALPHKEFGYGQRTFLDERGGLHTVGAWAESAT